MLSVRTVKPRGNGRAGHDSGGRSERRLQGPDQAVPYGVAGYYGWHLKADQAAEKHPVQYEGLRFGKRRGRPRLLDLVE